MTCAESLERGFASSYIDNVMTEKICFKCDRKRTFQEFKESKRLSSRFLMDNLMEMYHSEIEDIVNGNRSNISENISLLENRLVSIRARGDEDFTIKVEAFLSNLKIQSKTKEFETKVWFSGLQQIINSSKASGVSARPKNRDGFMVLTFCSAGRTMITIEDKKNSVTLITDETSSRSCMGWQGVDAIEADALALIDRAITMYQSGELKFKTDTKVGFGF